MPASQKTSQEISREIDQKTDPAECSTLLARAAAIACTQESPLRAAILSRIFSQAAQPQAHQLAMTVQDLTATRAEEAAEALHSIAAIMQKSGTKDKRQALSSDSLPLML